MLTDPITIERIVTATLLASLGVLVAFGPELGQVIERMRSRRVPDVVQDPGGLSAES